MKESKKTQLNKRLTKANVAEKSIEVIRELDSKGYSPFEVFDLGLKILAAYGDKSPSANVYQEAED